MKQSKIPKATITRLSIYYRQLELLESNASYMISSKKLALLCQVHPAQVRKDLGYFGEFGVRGVGYNVIELQKEIKKILTLGREWNMGLIGTGNLGSALMQHQNLPARGFKFVAIFDKDPNKIGQMTSTGLIIRDINELDSLVKELKIEIGVITTPPSAAQQVADKFLESHVYALLNFSPRRIFVPECCLVENIDFSVKLDILIYKLRRNMIP